MPVPALARPPRGATRGRGDRALAAPAIRGSFATRADGPARRQRLDAAARNAARPGYAASPPSASSIRRSWLYLATRSERDGAPVLICPQPVATARSAIVVSSVSPARCDITAV